MKTIDQKNLELFLRQKELLETFLSRKTITQEQFNKSYGDLCNKMLDADPAEVASALPASEL